MQFEKYLSNKAVKLQQCRTTEFVGLIAAQAYNHSTLP